MQVDKIELGTVIDHIRAGSVSKIMRFLSIDDSYAHRVALVLNVPSKKLGTKDILKIEGKVISRNVANAIALISPSATVNIIKNGKVAEKYILKLPQTLNSLGLCPNSNCISRESEARFIRTEKRTYQCHYCEKFFDATLLL